MRDHLKRMAWRSGALTLVQRAAPPTLTVLAYHRIADLDAGDTQGYRPNISAAPTLFAAQLDLIARRFTVIDLDRLSAWLTDGRPLPDHPALITFDDGYRDNLTQALPLLQARGMTATLFLTTDPINEGSGFYWDMAATCFERTRLGGADLPGLGPRHWSDDCSRAAVLDTWIQAVKALPETERARATAALPDALKVDRSQTPDPDLLMTWDDVRAWQRGGMTVGAHGCSHAILARVPEDRARGEIVTSKACIERELNQAVTAFAYPNGQRHDYEPVHQRLLAEAGYQMAFTLNPGPALQTEVRKAPFLIARCMVGPRDHPANLMAKLTGARRLAQTLRGAVNRGPVAP